MKKKRIFISSVQNEFGEIRSELCDYINADALLGRFFEPFIFEALPAIDQQVKHVYLEEVAKCTIYLGLFGKEYGFQTPKGISPTELEFDEATRFHLTRLVFITHHPDESRHPKELALIEKAQEVLVRKTFSNIDDLKASVYAALVHYLVEKEIIRTSPFDASYSDKAQLQDLEIENIKEFVRLARSKRGFPLQETDNIEKILTHLNIFDNNKLTHAALLLFGKEPQRFFISSEVRCALFHSTIVEKPIPSYKVFKGTVFELVVQTVEFILSKLDYSIGTRSEHIQIPGKYEIPKEVITEAVVNAIVHRDYTSNASVQVMMFRDRIEIWNPGTLPLGWSTDKLKQLHTSVPANPLLAEPMYLAGYVERLGTGTSDMVQKSLAAGLAEPQFIQEDHFITILYRPLKTKTAQVTAHVTAHVTAQVNMLVDTIKGEMTRTELMQALKLTHRQSFTETYLLPSLNQGLIEMTQPEKPRSINQKYRITNKGKALLTSIHEHDSKLENEVDTAHVTAHVTAQVTAQVNMLVENIKGEMTKTELMQTLKLTHRQSFTETYLLPSLNQGVIEMTLPDKPKSSKQKYRLTTKGKKLQAKFKTK